MLRTLKVTGNHVTYDRGAWSLRVIMSSSRSLCCLPSVKKQKHVFQVCFVDRAGHRKNIWRQGHTKHKKSTRVAKDLFADYVNDKKLSEPEEKKELTQTLKTFILHSVFVISRIIKVSTSTLIILDITKTSSNNCLKFQQCNMNVPSTNVRTIQDTLCIKDHCELYLRIFINLLSHTCPGSLHLNYALD